MAAQPKERLLKLLVLGEAAVGKSSVLLRFADGKWVGQQLETLGMDFREKRVVIDGKKVCLQVWDTAGTERFRTIMASLYRNAHGVVLMYDVTNQESFERLTEWLQDINLVAENAIVTIAGNKCDLVGATVVRAVRAEQFAKQRALKFFETSAKTGQNVNELFLTLAADIVKSDVHLLNPSDTVRSVDLRSGSEGEGPRRNEGCTCACL